MNIFLLHANAQICAEMHCDKHVIKMILEHCQLMYTAIHVLDPARLESVERINGLQAYKKTHVNHPCAKWARASRKNFQWLLLLTVCLVREKKYRWGGDHKCARHLQGLLWASRVVPFPLEKMTPWAIANPYKHMEAIESYRHYYIHDKTRMLAWKHRPVPDFISVSSPGPFEPSMHVVQPPAPHRPSVGVLV